jgi:hypothetical protein
VVRVIECGEGYYKAPRNVEACQSIGVVPRTRGDDSLDRLCDQLRVRHGLFAHRLKSSPPSDCKSTRLPMPGALYTTPRAREHLFEAPISLRRDPRKRVRTGEVRKEREQDG